MWLGLRENLKKVAPEISLPAYILDIATSMYNNLLVILLLSARVPILKTEADMNQEKR